MERSHGSEGYVGIRNSILIQEGGGRRCPLPRFTKRGETRRRKKRDPADAKPMGFTRNRDCAAAAPIILTALQANRREERGGEELISGEIRNTRIWLTIEYFSRYASIWRLWFNFNVDDKRELGNESIC